VTAQENNGKETANSMRELKLVLTQIECTDKLIGEAQQVSTQSGNSADAAEMSIYYATNRKRDDASGQFYGSSFSSTIQYGRAVLLMPARQKRTLLTLANVVNAYRSGIGKQYSLKAANPLGRYDNAKREWTEKGGLNKLLIYVHGYNENFADAALRAAQVKIELDFAGMVVLYSWPSAGRALAYWQDEEASALSEAVFERLISEISEFDSTEIYIVAVGMGTRIVSGAIRNRFEKRLGNPNIRALALVSADINRELFQNIIAPQLAGVNGMRTTLYVGQTDLAFRASKVVHGFARVAEADSRFVYPGLDVVEVQNAPFLLRGYGNLDMLDTTLVLDDLEKLFKAGAAPSARGLVQVGAHWRFPTRTDAK
jgi:esterase/lipase superfamily enzyme